MYFDVDAGKETGKYSSLNTTLPFFLFAHEDTAYMQANNQTAGLKHFEKYKCCMNKFLSRKIHSRDSCFFLELVRTNKKM